MASRLAAAATAVAILSVISGTARANDMVCVIPSSSSAVPFCVDGSGVVTLDGKEKAPFTSIRHVAVCGARLVVANSSEVAFRDGSGGWTKPGRYGKSVMGSLGCDARGAIFVGHKDGIAKFEGGQWTDAPYSAVNVANGTLDGVKRFITKPDGSLWAVLGRGLARYEGGEWKVIADRPALPSEQVRFSDAAADRDGRLWLLHSGGISMHDGKLWTAFKEKLIGPSGIAVDRGGAVWITVNDGIRTFSGGAWKKVLVGGMEPQIKLRDLAFDGKGRLWIASSWGLGVVENNVARFWRMTNSDVPFDDMRTLIMAGKGPANLPSAQDKPTGGIKGRIEGDGNAGLEGVRVEFCNVRLNRFGTFKASDTPCSTQAPLTVTTRTGKDGAFSVEKVPPGDYSVVVEREAGKWVLLIGSFGFTAELVRVASGKVTSVPTLTVKAK